MSGRTLGRRELLALTGLAALAGGCSADPAPEAAPTRTGAGGGAAVPTSGSPRPPVPPTTSPTSSGADLAHGRRSAPVIALTFHGAGSVAIARAVLSELANGKAHVTIFAVGSWLAAEPAMARAILDGGHELGNHTYTHLPMRTLSLAKATVEVARCAAVLTRLTGSRGPWFRPSGTPASTSTIRSAAKTAGYPQCVTYDLDSLDWTDPGAGSVTKTVLSQARGGSIVSLHLGHAGTVRALPSILEGLTQRSLQPVTVTEMFR